MRKQLLLLLFSLFAVMGYARTVTGVVTSEADKQPVIGATVMVQGTSTGTATDFDGKYTINAGDNDVLVFSYVGMETSNIKVNGRDVINVELKENSQVNLQDFELIYLFVWVHAYLPYYQFMVLKCVCRPILLELTTLQELQHK